MNSEKIIRHLLESVQFHPQRLDRGNGTIFAASIVGEKSWHGYTFSQAWHESAVPLIEGAKLGLDHPDWYVRKDKPLPTKLNDLVGRVRNVRYESDRRRIVGDLKLVKGAMRDRIFDLLESDPTLIGCSILHDSAVARDNPSKLIRCVALHRVDIVADPATTGGMFESKLDEDIYIPTSVERALAAIEYNIALNPQNAESLISPTTTRSYQRAFHQFGR